MKLRLKDKDLPPVQLRLTLPGSLKASLDEYVGYLHDSLHRETDAKEVAIEMLKHFVESDRDFRGWRSKREGGGGAVGAEGGEERGSRGDAVVEQDKGFTVLWRFSVIFPYLRRGISSPYRIALPRTRTIAKRALFPVVLCAGIAIPVLGFQLLGLKIGLTDSACPPGIYRMVNRAPSRGDLVLACLPDAIARFGSARGYLLRGRGCGDGIEPVGKRLSALPGDSVEVMRDYIAVNGQRLEHSATLSRDSRGRSVHHVAWGRYTVHRQIRCGCSEPKTREVGTLVTSGRCQRAQFEPRWSRFSRGELWRTDCTPESRDLESIISRISAGWLRLRGWTASRPTCCSVDYLNLPRVCRTFPPHAARRSPWQGERSSTPARLRSVPGNRGVDPRSCTV